MVSKEKTFNEQIHDEGTCSRFASHEEDMANTESADENMFLIFYEKIHITDNITTAEKCVVWVIGTAKDATRRAIIMQKNGHRVRGISVATCWLDKSQWLLSEEELKEKGPNLR